MLNRRIRPEWSFRPDPDCVGPRHPAQFADEISSSVETQRRAVAESPSPFFHSILEHRRQAMLHPTENSPVFGASALTRNAELDHLRRSSTGAIRTRSPSFSLGYGTGDSITEPDQIAPSAIWFRLSDSFSTHCAMCTDLRGLATKSCGIRSSELLFTMDRAKGMAVRSISLTISLSVSDSHPTRPDR